MLRRLRVRQAQRLILSASWALLLIGSAVISAGVSIWLKSQQSPQQNTDNLIPTWVLWAGAVAAVFLVIQAIAEFQRRTYDLTWIFKYDDRFNSKEMKGDRAKAARVLKAQQGQLSRCTPEMACIDDILDFFEDLGFAERGGQITPEVIHQNFHYWIRGYYSAAKEYIAAQRNDEKSRWDHLEALHEVVHEVSQTRNDGKAVKEIAGKELEKFLDFEIDFDNSKGTEIV